MSRATEAVGVWGQAKCCSGAHLVQESAPLLISTIERRKAPLQLLHLVLVCALREEVRPLQLVL